MRGKTTILLFALGLLLLGVNLAVQARRAQVRESRAREDLLLPVTLDEVERFSVEYEDGGAVAAARAGAQREWRLTAPVEDRIDREALDGLQALAVFARRDPDERVDAAAAGLEHPHLRLELATAKDLRLTLAVGRPTADGRGRYVESSAFPGEIHRAGADLLRFLDRAPAEFRSAELFALDPASALSVTIQAPGAPPLLLERGAEGWGIRQPIAWPADPDWMEAFLQRCAGLRALSVLAESPEGQDLAALGFGPREVRIRLATAQGLQTLRLAAPREEGTVTAALVEGRDPLFAVPDLLWREAAHKGLDACRDRRLDLLGGLGALGEVRIERPGDAVRLVGLSGGLLWQGTSPENFLVDVDAWRETREAFERARAVRFVAESADDPRAYGFHAPAVTLRLTGVDGRESESLVVGGPADRKGEWYARLFRRPVVFTLPDSFVSLLRRPWYDWRIRQLVRFELQDPIRLSIWRGGKESRYQRSSGDAWQMVLPRSAPADDRALYLGPLSHQGLGGLAAAQYVGLAASSDLAKFGLDPARMRVVVDYALSAGPQAPETIRMVRLDLEIGDPAGAEGFRYARLRSDEEGKFVFLLDGRIVKMLERDYIDPQAAP